MSELKLLLPRRICVSLQARHSVRLQDATERLLELQSGDLLWTMPLAW